MIKIFNVLILFLGFYLLTSKIEENFNADVDFNSNINYVETVRGNLLVNNYPPCFSNNKEATKIYNFLRRKELLQSTSNLLNCLSMILCQVKYLNEKDCSETMLSDRLSNLSELGFRNIYNNEYIKFNSIVYSFISTEDRLKISQSAKIFLTGCAMLINKNLEEISRFIFKDDFDNLEELINSIYAQNFPIIARKCQTG